MWERCGVVRDDAGLRDGIARLDEIRAVVADVDVRPSAEGWSDLAQLIDLQAGLLVAEATMRGAARAPGVARLPQPGRLPRARPRAPGQLLHTASVTTAGSVDRGASPWRQCPKSSFLGSNRPGPPASAVASSSERPPRAGVLAAAGNGNTPKSC